MKYNNPCDLIFCITGVYLASDDPIANFAVPAAAEVERAAEIAAAYGKRKQWLRPRHQLKIDIKYTLA